LEEFQQDGLRGVQAVGSLIDDQAAAAVEDFIRDFHIATHRHRMQEARFRAAAQKILIDTPVVRARAA
jgi:1,4-alpha-glucan branching enzyme